MSVHAFSGKTFQSIITLCGVIIVGGVVNMAAAQEVTSPMVYQNVGTLLNEVEQVRQVMGRRSPRERTFRLSGVDSRQVFFQAQTLFRKCNQLAQEVAGVSRRAPPSAPEGDIMPANVYAMVTQAREQLGLVKKALGIGELPETPALERRKEPADVMHDIIEAGYILNRLMNSPSDWSSIYDRTVQMIAYIGGVLPEASRYPDLPAHVCCKMPRDVQAELLSVMEGLRPSAERVKFSLVRVEVRKAPEGGSSTNTVYDLTTTMISDIAEVTLRLDAEDVAAPTYERPARIFPSHVYQLALVLQEQVKQL